MPVVEAAECRILLLCRCGVVGLQNGCSCRGVDRVELLLVENRIIVSSLRRIWLFERMRIVPMVEKLLALRRIRIRAPLTSRGASCRGQSLAQEQFPRLPICIRSRRRQPLLWMPLECLLRRRLQLADPRVILYQCLLSVVVAVVRGKRLPRRLGA